MCHVAAVLERNAAGKLKRGYVINYIDSLRELTRHVQCNQTLSQLSNLGWLLHSAVASCYISGRQQNAGSVQRVKMHVHRSVTSRWRSSYVH